ncbi:MAG: ankyrin repeat domain-containing protein [Terracidiphilus sp.]
MASNSRIQVVVSAPLPFLISAAIFLWPACGWAQGKGQTTFTSAIPLKVDARPVPAKVTSDDESVLADKGYVEIGTVRAENPGKNTGEIIVEALRASALSKAGEAGGDVVHFDSEGRVDKAEVPTGKMASECTRTADYSVAVPTTVHTCTTDAHGFTNCSDMPGAPSTGYVNRCVAWGEPKPVYRKVEGIVSEGTVWRNEPGLEAKVMSAKDVARRVEEAENVAHLAHGADVNAKDTYGLTPLGVAAFSGENRVAEALLTLGADVNGRNDKGDTPLGSAVSNGKRDMAELLLAHGADVNAKNNEGNTPLGIAASANQREILEFLVSHGAEINARNLQGDIPLGLAASRGQREIVEFLVAHGAELNAKNEHGETPVSLAEREKHEEVVDLLRRHGGRDAQESPLQTLSEKLTRNPDYVHSRDSNGSTPLLLVARDGSNDEAELLMAHGADVNATDNSGDTPLIIAAEYKQRDVAEALLNHGAYVNVRDKYGDDPLIAAAQHGNREVAELLLSHGANVKARDKDGDDPLITAAQYGNRDVAEVLLTHGADVKVTDGLGDTPLIIAAKLGNRDVAEVLLNHGADVNATDKKIHHTALFWARDSGKQDLVDFLRQHGGHE